MDLFSEDTAQSQEFYKNIMFKLNEYRKQGHLCDVRLEAGGREFPVHKAVLSAACEYFDGMFSASMVEKDEAVISLPLLDSVTTEAILNYLYTGAIELQDRNHLATLAAADFLLLEELRKMALVSVENTLEKNVERPSSAIISVFLFANRYSLEHLKVKSRRLILDYFERLCRCEEFLQLEANQLDEILRCDQLIVSSEETVLKALLYWTKYSLNLRKEDFSILLDNIHLASISDDVIAKMEIEELRDKCHRLKRYGRNVDSTCRQEPRRCFADESMVLFVASANRKAWFYNPLLNRWLAVPLTAAEWRVPHSSACCNGIVYMYDEFFKCLQCYIPTWQRWKTVATPLGNAHLVDIQLVSFQGCLYIIGDSYKGGAGIVQRYLPGLDSWQFVSPMNIPRFNPCIVTTADRIYVIGGNREKPVEEYNPTSNSWKVLAPLINSQGCAFGWAIDGKIFVIKRACREDNKTEVYDIKNDTWELTAISETKSVHEMCSVGNSVYLFQFFETGHQVVFFDGELGSWESRSLKAPFNVPPFCTISGPVFVSSRLFSL